MNYIKALFSGFLVWLSVSITFFILENIPVMKESFITEIVIIIAIVFYAVGSAALYYKKENKPNGLLLGITMSATALLLDTFITVPFIEIPNGRGYEIFFSSPFLWLLVSITILSVYFYWRKKIRTAK
ncbi:DUF5367 family protein [Flavobacterium piscis]|uniref:Heme exporter protein D n=1 Tax=Flavobacterium piscis TaxID=1114874 RepID=A0ABU1YDL6_9FLAO|nr:DUF5367 family protein [Flavobacterium piscis]MDR7211616.1 heme exporter protein D [Flavobacterium piscis]